MQRTMPTVAANLVHRVGQVSAANYLIGWTLAAIEDNPPETESQRMELYQGMCFVLETTRQVLGDVYRELSEENPAR